MKPNSIVFSLVHIIIVLLFFLVGGFCFAISQVSLLRMEVAQIILERPGIVFSLGLIIFSFGVLLMIGFTSMHRRRYYKVAMGTSKTLIDESIIREYVQHYWATLFPNKQFDLDIIMHGKERLEVITQIPQTKENNKELLTRVQNELGVILARKLGYEKDFVLTITEA